MTKNLPEKHEMSVPDAASALGVSTATIYNRIKAGILTAHSKWGRTLLDRREVDRIVKENE
jgi:excisionase family DNA binding protein|tara:strand:+ start:674 stop:856 length:183 start_codon:yes stop_codon:yes gene_type:complete